MAEIYTEEKKIIYERIEKVYYKVNYRVIKIKEGVKEIPDFYFNGQEDILEVILPSSVEKIGRGAFNRCYNLQRIELNEGLKEIGDSAFSEVLGMQMLEIPKTVNVFGKSIIKKSAISKIAASEDQIEKIALHLASTGRAIDITPAEKSSDTWSEYKISGKVGNSERVKKSGFITRNTYKNGSKGPVIVKTERYNTETDLWTEIPRRNSKSKDEDLSK